jgi:hypothetical protein
MVQPPETWRIPTERAGFLRDREEVWNAPRFEKHLVNVIQWVLGDLE